MNCFVHACICLTVAAATARVAAAAPTITVLHAFNGTDGISPYAPLFQASDGNFYGTTLHGGDDGHGCAQGCDGTVFKITLKANSRCSIHLSAEERPLFTARGAIPGADSSKARTDTSTARPSTVVLSSKPRLESSTKSARPASFKNSTISVDTLDVATVATRRAASFSGATGTSTGPPPARPHFPSRSRSVPAAISTASSRSFTPPVLERRKMVWCRRRTATSTAWRLGASTASHPSAGLARSTSLPRLTTVAAPPS